MGKYSKLRETLRYNMHFLADQINDLSSKLEKYQKIKKSLDKFASVERDKVIFFDITKLNKLSRFFPELSDEFRLFNNMCRYKMLVENSRIHEVDLNAFQRDITDVVNFCGLSYEEIASPVLEQIKEVKDLYSTRLISLRFDGIYHDEPKLRSTVMALAFVFFNALVDYLSRYVEKLYDVNQLNLEIDMLKKDMARVREFFYKFSDDKLLSKFNSGEELNDFIKLITPLMGTKEVNEILNYIMIDQQFEEEEEVEVQIDFSNLDMSFFNDEEKDVIEELREIIEDEEIENTNIDFSPTITYSDREKRYQDLSIESILFDAKSNLLNNIYDNKQEVIKIFKLIITLYRKNNLRVLRNYRVDVLKKIISDFNNIIVFIQKTNKDYGNAFIEKKRIQEYINDIENNYLPIAMELRDTNYEDGEFYDEEIEKAIRKYKIIIKEIWKEMSVFYQEEDIETSNLENTDNLVFCLNDFDLTDESHQKEFLGTVDALESMSSQELKRSSGRKGMSRIRKTIENGKEKDFVDYFENKRRIKIHFVPYRYSSESNTRTGLIKFEPSAKVKDFLEKRYGLSKQSAYYGIFEIITVIRADHSEYSFFEEYILNNYKRIEEIALLFASEDPDYDKLVVVIESMLKIKKDKIASVIEQR